MSDKPIGSDERLLTLKDRINYPYILSTKLLTIDEAIKARTKSGQESRREIEESIFSLDSSIPVAYKDDDYEIDMEKANKKVIIDNRPLVCGVPISEKACSEQGITPYTEETERDPFIVLQAIINLLNRRGMLSKTQWMEIATGNEYKDEDSEGDSILTEDVTKDEND